MSDLKILEVGGGSIPIFRPNMDVRPMPTVDIVADLNSKWPIDDTSYDQVFSRYCLEHISWRNVEGFVAELARVLKPGGSATVITANTEAQMRWALNQEEIGDKVGQCLFGDLDYGENSHKAALSPAYVTRLFRAAGFADVFVFPEGALGTDMLIEARKPMTATTKGAASWSPAERRAAYDRRYFDGGRGEVGGYAREGYWDYPCHWTTFRKVMEKQPASVLELGCARGYIVKRLQDAGVTAVGMEVSRHCILTRVCDDIVEQDITQVPWPFRDGQFDLCISVAALEHIPEAAIPKVAAEIQRVSQRGLHGVDFGDHDDGFDKTHTTFHDRGWWLRALNPPPLNSTHMSGAIATSTFPELGPQEVVEKDDLEKPLANPPPDGKVKLNLGSFTTMFHHGWVNLDIVDLRAFAYQHGYIHRQCDLRGGIPYDDGSVDLLFASHFLEHLNYVEGIRFLTECYRVMKEGAVMRLVIPDALRLCVLFTHGNQQGLSEMDELNEGCARSPHAAGKLWELLFAGHSALYDFDAVRKALVAAGFETGKVSRVAFREGASKQLRAETLDLLPEISIYVEAVK